VSQSRILPPPQSQRSASVMVIYWVMVLGGLAMFTATRTGDPATLAPLWIGAIGGTILGQYLALHDLRLWLAGAIIALVGLYCEPLLPSGHGSAQLWQAFIPAALCAFWSLGDRAVLAAAWFPAVLWMLAILDRNDQPLAPDGVAAVLLGALALLFVGFLRVRESRRVDLWRTVSPEPLAPVQPAELLREPPARQLARVGWGLTASAITVALTVWLAPPLWQTETLSGEEIALAAGPSDGLPCCPLHQVADTESSRVREYLDIGLGHDEHSDAPREGMECRVCGDPVVGAAVVGDPTGPLVPVAPDDVPVGRGTTYGTVHDTPSSAPGNTTWSAPAPSFHQAMPSNPLPLAAGDPAPVEPAPVQPPEPPPPPPPPPPAPPRAAPVVPPPPAVAPSPPPQPGVTSRTGNPHRVASDSAGSSLLRWLALAILAAVILQLVRLALRPLRRLVTLRHLRRPFWAETIDQRVSNSWQLALIGLRDAGWRAGVTEAPHELARRVKVDGLDRCATVLERARHGVGLDPDDLAEMRASADIVYRAARTGIGSVARAIGWLRWPLT
jgi:hypothetical protein